MASRGKSSGATRARSARAGPGATRSARAPPRRASAAPEAARAGRRAPRFVGTRLDALIERPNLSAALLIGLFVLIYLWPALLGGEILSPNALLYALDPWRAYAPADLQSHLNILLSDVPMADYPWRVLVRDLIHHGTFPAWNPHAFAGTPLYSNPQTGLFSLFSLPLWILPLNYAIGLGAALKLWAGGFGTYLLVRQLRLGFLPGLLAGVAFAFSAINITWLTHETLPAVAVMLPWMVLFVERIFARGRLGDGIGLAVVTAIGIGGGHPGMQVHLVVMTGLYVLLRAAFAEPGERGSLRRALLVAGGGLAFGALLMAVMLLPEALSSRGTLGTFARQGGRSTLPGSVMPFDAIKTVLFPDWWGRPSAFELESVAASSAGGAVNYNERTFYAGAVALLLACVGLLARGEGRRKAPFAVLGAIGLAIPLHAPGLYWLATHLPVLKDVQSQRLHFVFAFGVSVLAAFGLQALIERPEQEPRRFAVPAVALAGGLVALASIHLLPGDFGHAVKHFLTGADFQSAGVLALTTVFWFLLFALGVGAAMLALRRWPHRAAAIAVALVALAAADAYHFAHGYQPMGPASAVIPPRTPAIAYLQRHATGTRFIGLGYTVTNDWSLTYGLDDVRGYDVPQPTLRFYRLWRTANPEQSNWQPFTIESVNPEAVRVVSVLGAGYVAAAPGVGTPPSRDAVLRPLRRVYAGRDATVFANPNAVPRALVAPRVQLTGNEDATRAALIGEGFDPRRTVVVERDQPGAAALAGARPGRGRVRIAHDENARVTLEATLQRRGLVVLNDDFTAGWTVRVDGHAAPALHVNDVMRGVIVGPGRHEIVWSYAVPGLRAGFVLSLLAFVALVGGGIALRVRARRRS